MHTYNTHAWKDVYARTCTALSGFSNSQHHLTHGNHRKQEPYFPNKDLLGCMKLHRDLPCSVYGQVAASGAGARLWLWSICFCWGVCIPLSRHHVMHRIYNVSAFLSVSSCIHAYVSVGVMPCLHENILPIVISTQTDTNQSLDTDTIIAA